MKEKRRKYFYCDDRPIPESGYPTYWHVRGYGFVRRKSFGSKKVFNGGKEELTLNLLKDKSADFR